MTATAALVPVTVDLREVVDGRPTGYRTGPALINGVRIWCPDAFDVANQISHQLGRSLSREECQYVTDTVIGGDGRLHEMQFAA